MKSAPILLALSALALASPQGTQPAGCQPLPKAAQNLGATSPPMKKENIPAGCNEFEVLVARGTSETDAEPGGKFGVVVGDPVIGNLTKAYPKARGYPVQYPANGNVAAGVRKGWTDVVERVTSQSKACPQQKFALIGYSQGAAVMHYAAEKIPKELLPKVVALVMFGDPALKGSGPKNPAFPAELQARLLQNCNEGDSVCDPKGKCFFPHLAYQRQAWVDKTVKFLVAAFEGKPIPGKTSGTGL